jgi:translation initiation factor 2B subunit (eIF-2B alpha/beta/delta family)
MNEELSLYDILRIVCLQVMLLHGFSRVVLAVLTEALAKKKRFKVIVTESRPDSNWYTITHQLKTRTTLWDVQKLKHKKNWKTKQTTEEKYSHFIFWICLSQKTLERLLQKQISVTLIPDTTVAYIMHQVFTTHELFLVNVLWYERFFIFVFCFFLKVDLVLVGAEAVVENGGVINRVRILLSFFPF